MPTHRSPRRFIAPVVSAVTLALLAASTALAQDVPIATHGYLISTSELFVYFFVMLGPIKLLAPFTRVTAGADDKLRHGLALRAIGVSVIALVLAATLGTFLLKRWEVSGAALLLAAAAVLFWVAFRMVTRIYTAPRVVPPGTGAVPPPQKSAAIAPIAFPSVVTPYGVALVILLVANAGDPRRMLTIALALTFILALDLLVMWFARPIMKVVGSSLQMVAAVLGVLQVALAVELGIQAFVMLGVLDQPPV